MKSLALCALVLLATASTSADAQARPDGRDCQDSAVTELEMERCADRARAAADEELNRTYRSIVTQLSPTQASGLRAAQRAWIVYRDLDCTSVRAGYGGGTGATLAGLTCLARHTRDRTALLYDLYGVP